MRRRRLAAWALTLGLALLGGASLAQPSLTLRGEVGLDAGAYATRAAGETRVGVPLRVRAHLDAEAVWGDVALHLIASPALGAGEAGPPGTSEELVARPGVEEAFLRLRRANVDLSAGLERWAVGEMRLGDVVRLDGRLATGEPRGPLGARLAYFPYPWRLRAGLLVPVDSEARLGSLGGAASVRRESGPVTIEGHAFWTERPALGVSASGTLGELVTYGEGWLLADPWAGRAGLGLTGYAGDVLWTAEAVWAPEGGRVEAAGRPALRANATVSPARDVSLDVTAGLAWPEARGDPGQRTSVLDLSAALGYERPDASWQVRPSLRMGHGVTTYGLGTSVRGYF